MKRKMGKQLALFARIMAAAFLLILAILVVCNTVTKDRDFSEKENRVLSGKPDFTWSRLTDGRYMTQFETYVNDQFVFRDGWIQLKTLSDTLLGKKEENGVYLGKNDRLLEQFTAPEDTAVTELTNAVNSFAKRHEKLKQYFLLAPTAVNIYSEDLPLWAPAEDQNKVMDSFFGKLDTSLIQKIDVRSAFEAEKEADLYYHTDHHWTTNGAYLAFQTAAGVMDLDLKAVSYEHYPVTDSFQGTLSAKSGFLNGKKESIEAYFPQQTTPYIVSYVEEQKKEASVFQSESLKTRDKYSLFFGGNHSLIEIQTASSRNKRLLVLKDSYANCFIPFLIPYYRDIVIVDPRYYYDSIDQLIEDYDIQEVLYLYNANTFFSDTSLQPALQAVDEATTEEQSTKE